MSMNLGVLLPEVHFGVSVMMLNAENRFIDCDIK